LISFIEALGERGAFTIVATHFDDVAEAAAVPHLRIAGLGDRVPSSIGAGGPDDALDAIGIAMDYRIVPASGASAGSDALALAQILGLDGRVVERAQEIYYES
jgi:DNA mismatch repair ATPase MutS